jgi:hypothetical protein
MPELQVFQVKHIKFMCTCISTIQNLCTTTYLSSIPHMHLTEVKLHTLKKKLQFLIFILSSLTQFELNVRL